jgi:hypothetical protein
MDMSALALVSVRGVLIQEARKQSILIVGVSEAPIDFRYEVFRGKMYVAAAVALLYELDYLIPARLIDDFRQQHFGFDAIRFMLTQGETFPRADVMGIRVSDHFQMQAFVRELDLGKPLKCVVYTDDEIESMPIHIDRIVLENTGLLDSQLSVLNNSIQILALPVSEVYARYG